MHLQIEPSFFPHLGKRGNIALNINKVLRLTNPSIFATFIMGIFGVKIKQNHVSETLRPFCCAEYKRSVVKTRGRATDRSASELVACTYDAD